MTQLGSTSGRPNVSSEGRSNKATVYFFPNTETTVQFKAWVVREIGSGTVIVQADAQTLVTS